MTIDALKEYVHAKPFKPFVLFLSNGRKMIIPDSTHIAFQPGKVSRISVAELEGTFAILDPQTITRAEPLVTPQAVMTKQAIKDRIEAVPFCVFFVRLADGRTYKIPGPGYASVSPDGSLMTVFTHGGSGVQILDVALITEIFTTESSE